MMNELRNASLKLLLSAALSGSVALGGASRLLADDPKPATDAKPPAKASEAAKTDEKKADAAQPADPHAGHNHGPVKPADQPAGPPTPQVKPGNELPKPTVELKPGEVPAVKFDTPIYDFGKVKSGTDIKHDFFFTNTGTGPLEILRVKPSCGCTVAGQHDRVVQPGQTGKIPITLSSKNASGPISKTVTVNTNISGTDATIMLQIKGEVWQPVQVTPQAAAFGRITSQDATQQLSRKLTIQNNMETPINPGTPVSNSPKVKAELSTIEEGKKYELTVTLVPPLDSGNTTARITVPTGATEVPSLEVSAYAFVTAAVDVTPTSLVLPGTRATDLSRQFYIRSNAGKPVTISDLTVTNPAIKLELTDIKDKVTYRLKVDVPKDYVASEGGDKITFKTDSPEVPSITIPITLQPALGARPAVPSPRPLVPANPGAKPAAAPNTAAAKPAAADDKNAGNADTAKKEADAAAGKK